MTFEVEKKKKNAYSCDVCYFNTYNTSFNYKMLGLER